jgi:hypothetical protein
MVHIEILRPKKRKFFSYAVAKLGLDMRGADPAP